MFGVAYVGPGRRVEPSLEAIARAALELLDHEHFSSFRIEARRAYTNFPHTSQEINEKVGHIVKEATGAEVKLRGSGATVWVELFAGAGLVYCRKLEGVGGLPTGTSAKMLALLSGGIDSPVAAWRMARRGADVELLHFHSRPYTDASSTKQARALGEILARYQNRAWFHVVPLADAQKEITAEAPPGLRTVLYRRTMARIAEGLADERGAKALVTGDSLGQVASQTFGNMAVVDEVMEALPILRPLVGMDKQEIIDDAKRIGSYEVSIRKYQDTCVLFDSRSPATHVKPAEAARAEMDVDIARLVKSALAEASSEELVLPPATASA